MKPQIILLATLVLIGVACKKDKKGDPPPPPAVNPQGELLGPQPSFKLVRIIERDSNRILSSTKIDYDTENRVTSISNETSGSRRFRIEYAGDTMKYFITLDQSGNEILRKEYPLKIFENGQRFELTSYWPGDEFGVDTTINVVLIQDGRVKETQNIVRYPNPTDNAVGRRTFAYDTRGNLVAYSRFIDTDVLESNNIHSFDTHKNGQAEVSNLIYLFVSRLGFLSSSSNNIMGYHTSDGYNFEYEYTYDREGYAITRKRVGQGALPWIEYQYEY